MKADISVVVAGGSLADILLETGEESSFSSRVHELYRRGADLGDPFSHMELANEARVSREGKAEDLALALFHYTIAARLLEGLGGDGAALATAQAHRATVAHALPNEAVARVWYAAHAWAPKH